MNIDAATAPGEPQVTRSRRGLAFWLPLGWLALVVALAAGANLLPIPSPTDADYTTLAARPGSAHWFGTDALGRDLFARTLFGARVSLAVGVLAPAIGLGIGLALGLAAGWFRGRTEAVVVALTDAMLAFPGILVALAVTAFVGADLIVLVGLLGVLSVPAFARVARANTLLFAQREFVVAARAMGASPWRVLTRELLPNVAVPMMVYALLVVARVVVVEGVLSFLGLSVPPPTPTWGNLIAEGQADLLSAPHLAFIPAAVLCLTVLSLNLLGERLRAGADLRGSLL